MDTFFVSHGSPALSIDDSLPARAFLQSWRSKVLQDVVPRAILIVSGHWETSGPCVNAVHGTSPVIYDFYGFPNSMYQVTPVELTPFFYADF